MSDDSQHIEDVFRIEEIKTELAGLSNDQMVFEKMGEDLSPEVEKQFLEQVLAYERAELVTHKELLARDGVSLPAPDEMTDDELALKLIEVIHTLAEHRIFLENTNHFSDRQLYSELWEDGLNETEAELPPEFMMNCHFDMVGSGSEEHTRLWLTYYADEKTRMRWVKDYPEMELPAHQDPPYDRDRHLPKPPAPPNPFDDPEVEQAWWRICREKLLCKLSNDGIDDVIINDEPLSYAPDLACVWAIERTSTPGTVEWWAISGDLPTTYLPTVEIPDPRAFLCVVSQRWRTSSDAMESGNPDNELTSVAPNDWPRVIPMLRHYAFILNAWAGDDTAWEE